MYVNVRQQDECFSLLTGRVTVHTEAVPPHVPDGLDGHCVALTAQPRLQEIHRGNYNSAWGRLQGPGTGGTRSSPLRKGIHTQT